MPQQWFQASRGSGSKAIRLTALVLIAGLGGLYGGQWALNAALRRAYGLWKPILERQVSRVMGHPFTLGPFQGIGWGGVRLGATSLGPGPLDGSTLFASGGAVSLDPLASWRQGLPVLQISLDGVRAQLQANRQGQWWVLGQLPPHSVPPRLDLRFRLRQPARLTLAKAPRPLLVQGRFEVVPHRRSLRLQGQLNPATNWRDQKGNLQGDPGSIGFRINGRWDLRQWQARLRLAKVSMAAWQQTLGGSQGLNGFVGGELAMGLMADRPSCQGHLQLQDLRWQPSPIGAAPGKAMVLELPQVEGICQGQQLSIRPAAWHLGQWRGQLAAQASWSKGQWRVNQISLRSGSSWLRGQGLVSRRLDWRAQWQVRPGDWWSGAALPNWLSRGPIAGSLQLRGSAAHPDLALQASQGGNPVLGPWRAALRWQQQILRLEQFRSASLRAEGALPLALLPSRGWQVGNLDLNLALERFPLSRLSPVVSAPLGGFLEARGRIHGPVRHLRPDIQLRLHQPSAGPLSLDETWVGSWLGDPAGGGRLTMQALAPAPLGQLTALLNRRWLPTVVSLQRGKGSLNLQGRPSLYRWRAANLPLANLRLALGPLHRPQPLEGALSGEGQLSLQPLAFSGRAQLDRPVFLGIWARKASLQGHYTDRRFQALGAFQPLGGGQLEVDWQGRWQGAFRATAKGRQLSDRFWRQMAAAWPQWLGKGWGSQGSARNLGLLTIQSFGQTLQQQLELLTTAKGQLEARRIALESSLTPMERIGQIGALVDADLNLAGPSLTLARADLAAKAQLWLHGDSRDTALTQQPLTLSYQGQVLQADGQFGITGLPLSLLALLMPVPEGLRGELGAKGQIRLGRRRPELEVDLALTGAALGDTALDLQRGRVELKDQSLVLDVALHGAGAKNNLELAGRIPLDPSSQELELRMASRDDGLLFITSLAQPAFIWKSGKADLQLLVRGSLQDPIANGFVRVRGAEFQCLGQRLQAVEALALFDFQQLVVQELSARVGPAGLISGKGTLGLVHAVANLPGLNLTLKSVPFNLGRIRAMANGQLHVDGSLNAMLMGGDLAISKGSLNIAPSPIAPANGSRQPVTSVSTLLEERWNFQQPLVLLGADGSSSASEAAQNLVPHFPALGFNNLRFSLGPDLTVGIPNLASFGTVGALRLNGRLDPSLTVSGVVRLQRGRLSLFTTTFSLDPDTPNVAIFTPSLGLVPYLDIALRTRVSDSLNVPGNSLGTPLGPSLTDFANQGSLSSMNQLNLVRVYLSVSGPADRLARNLRLRSSPPLPEERLLALIGGNTLAGLAAGQAGAAIATALGQTLLSPLVGGLSDALGQRVSFALYPTYVNSQVSGSSAQRSGRVPTQLVLGSEIGLDITQRFNASVLAAPNRSDVPPQLNLNYKASDLINLQGSIDSQGALGAQLQLFLRF